MAAIVQSNKYNCLIRKIGYSVGLESLLERSIFLSEYYADQKSLSFAAWDEIVKKKYGLKGENSTVHVANFFSSVDLIRLFGREIIVLPGLETLSILKRYYGQDTSNFVEAVKFYLILKIIEADGDIFLNCLEADFKAEKLKALLQTMIKEKREAIKNAVKVPSILNAIFSIIDIKHQGASSGSSGSPFEKRTTASPSPFEKRTTPLSEAMDISIKISDDYLKKVPQTRKGWSSELGLYNADGITNKGAKLLENLRSVGLVGKNDAFVFWPYEKEILNIHMKCSDLGATQLTQWDLIEAIFSTNGNIIEGFEESKDYGDVLKQLKELFVLYQEGSLGRGKIRHVLPIYIAQPCFAAIKYVEHISIPKLPNIIDREIRSRTRRIDKMIIRGTEGAISFRD